MKNDQHSVTIPANKLFTKKTSSVRKLKFSLLSAVILLVVFCIVVIFLGVNYSDLSDELDSICRTPECIRSASIILQSMNKSVDPCDNFYEYACGRWRFDHPIPPTSMSNTWSVEKGEAQLAKIQQFLEKSTSDTEPYNSYVAKSMYKACIDTYRLDELGTEPLKEILDQMNLPLLPPLQESDYDLNIDISSLLARIKTTIDQSMILHGTVSRDVRNKTRNLITINGPTDDSTLPSKRLYKRGISRNNLRKKESDDDDENNVSGPWERYFSYIIRYFLKATNVSNVTDEFISDTATTLLHIAYTIESVGDDKEISTANTAHPTLMTLSELQNMTDEASLSEEGLTSKIDWRLYLETLFENTEVTVDFDNTELAVYTLEYYKMMSKVLAHYSDQEIVLYLWSEVIYVLIPYVSEEMRIMQHTLLRPLGETTAEPRKTHCSNAVLKVMDKALAYELIKDVDLKSIKEDVEKMIDNIQYAAMKHIEAADWIDSITKSAIIEKFKSIERHIGYPNSLLSNEDLDVFYSWLNVSEETHMFNFVNASQAVMKSTLEQLYEENNFTDADSNPLDINAYYSSTTNSIKIPIGILQFPFYDLGLDAMNYGAIGGVIGHELTHAFDKEGKEYDKDGNVRVWWTNATNERYSERAECFINHYNQYYVEEIDKHVDGNLTLSENLADNGGLKDAFYGYQKLKAGKDERELKLPGLEEFSDDKLFFFGFAHYNCENWTPKYMERRLDDEHSPNFASVLGVLKNSKEFAKTWDCPAKSEMNPKTKCQLW